ncbi:Hypothetical_protein [Hexamita inflata]|uniref:Hypothetical_protein n=1 Tax=Hexamita inflata TaxID=28002 RepID=A0AA86Q0C9_9EUKA|nr:Hypothetical protein HINF_LOCUS31882 [Hexamita inflata]CAI9944246.1 Hypothetical protein HINF_LOCUS31891 [Hexamita inflata]
MKSFASFVMISAFSPSLSLTILQEKLQWSMCSFSAFYDGSGLLQQVHTTFLFSLVSFLIESIIGGLFSHFYVSIFPETSQFCKIQRKIQQNMPVLTHNDMLNTFLDDYQIPVRQLLKYQKLYYQVVHYMRQSLLDIHLIYVYEMKNINF